MSHPIGLEFRKQLLQSRLIEVLDTGATIRGYQAQARGIGVQKARYERTLPCLQVLQHPDLVGKAVRGIGAEKGLDHPTIEGEVNRGPQGVFDLQHEAAGRIRPGWAIRNKLRLDRDRMRWKFKHCILFKSKWMQQRLASMEPLGAPWPEGGIPTALRVRRFVGTS